jgi:hypothetical protein
VSGSIYKNLIFVLIDKTDFNPIEDEGIERLSMCKMINLSTLELS